MYSPSFMSLEHLPVHLDQLPRPDKKDLLLDTAEKIVFPAVFAGEKVAVKIYRKKDTGMLEPVDQAREAKDEYEFLIALHNSPLSPYLPKNTRLLMNRGNVIGLLAEWKEGATLSSLYGLVQIPDHILLTLQQCFLYLPHEYWPDPDGFSEGNICWDGSKLWLAELHSCKWGSAERYQQSVTSTFKLLLRDYGSTAALR